MKRTSERMVVTTGSDEASKVRAAREVFFANVLKKLGLKPNIPFAERTTYALGMQHDTKFAETDNRLHTLAIGDEVVATVLDRRNDANFHEVTFMARPPSPSLRKFIARVKEAAPKKR